MSLLPSLSRVWRGVRSDLTEEVEIIRSFCAKCLPRPAEGREPDNPTPPGSRQPAPSSLFRSQVVDARKDLWLGEAQLVHPLPVRIVAATCVVLASATLLFIAFGSYTRRVHAEGMLAPNVGLITVASPSAGRIGSSGVLEGGKVEKGQLLYTIDVDAVSTSGPTQKRVITELGSHRRRVSNDSAPYGPRSLRSKRRRCGSNSTTRSLKTTE